MPIDRANHQDIWIHFLTLLCDLGSMIQVELFQNVHYLQVLMLGFSITENQAVTAFTVSNSASQNWGTHKKSARFLTCTTRMGDCVHGVRRGFLMQNHQRRERMGASCLQSNREVDIVQHKSKDAKQEPDFQDLPLYQPKGSPDRAEDPADLRKHSNDRGKASQLSAGCPSSIQPIQLSFPPVAQSSRGAAELPFLGGGIQGCRICWSGNL